MKTSKPKPEPTKNPKTLQAFLKKHFNKLAAWPPVVIFPDYKNDN
jgi:hypothetical protein